MRAFVGSVACALACVSAASAAAPKPLLSQLPVTLPDSVVMNDESHALATAKDDPNRIRGPIYEFGRARALELYYLAPTTLVRASAPGYVRDVRSAGPCDSQIRVTPARKTRAGWVVVYDHVTAVTVKRGQKVAAGQALGKVSPMLSGCTGLGRVALQVAFEGAPKQQFCPLSLMPAKARDAAATAVLTTISNWQVFAGFGFYDVANDFLPGCTVPYLG